MLLDAEELAAAVNTLVDEYRDRCLWFVAEGYYPSTDEERMRFLAQIRRHGDRAAYLRAAELQQWLLADSNERSAGG